MLILNADDFGHDSATNEAIVTAFEAGFCSSTTLMANMDGFEEACQLVHEQGLLDFVGLHLNLSEGAPLTERIRRCPRFCDPDGSFRLLRSERVFFLSADEKRALAEEIRAQISRLRAQRLRITHLDSHKHIHEEWGILHVLLPIIKEMRIPYLRMAGNVGPFNRLVKRGYRWLVNRKITAQRLTQTRYFGSLLAYNGARASGEFERIAESVELMVHPGRDASGVLVDTFHRRPLAELIESCAFRDHPVSYAGAEYRPKKVVRQAGGQP